MRQSGLHAVSVGCAAGAVFGGEYQLHLLVDFGGLGSRAGSLILLTNSIARFAGTHPRTQRTRAPLALSTNRNRRPRLPPKRNPLLRLLPLELWVRTRLDRLRYVTSSHLCRSLPSQLIDIYGPPSTGFSLRDANTRSGIAKWFWRAHNNANEHARITHRTSNKLSCAPDDEFCVGWDVCQNSGNPEGLMWWVFKRPCV